MEARKKIGGWKSFDFGPAKKEIASLEPKVENFQRIPSVSKVSEGLGKKLVKEIFFFNFHDQVQPKTVSDLAVHPKKILEVEDWLRSNVFPTSNQKKSSYLLLSGPTGSGKSITITTLCKYMGITISEWVNPMDQDYEYKGQNQVSIFLEFLLESKWASLFEKENRKITLVKDFPNVMIQKPEQFFEILEECSYKVDNPIVFICTEHGSTNINLVRKLFPETVMSRYNITHISFNAVASTIMKGAIKRVQAMVKEHPTLFKQPSPLAVDAILASGDGDIRNTMNQFYIASLIGSKEVPTISSNIQPQGTKKRKKDKDRKLQCMIKDESLGLFHGLGRVLCPKRKEVNGSWRLHHDVGKLVEEFFTFPAMFTSFLFENYLKYFGDINDASKAASILSFTANIFDNWADRQESLTFVLWVSVLGVMVYNEHKVSKWNQITGPTKITSKTSPSEAMGLNPTDFFYYNIIKKSDRFHRFKIEA